MAANVPTKDLYDILGADRDATHSELKALHRDLAMKYHPDRNKDDPEATEMFISVSAAWATLGDPEAREIYNRTGQRQAVNLLEVRALERIGQAFTKILSRDGEGIGHTDVITEIEGMCRDEIEDKDGGMAANKERIKMLQSVAKRIRCTGPHDVMTRCLTQDQEYEERKLLDAEFQINALTRTLEMLVDFTFKFDGAGYSVHDRRTQQLTGGRLRLSPDWDK